MSKSSKLRPKVGVAVMIVKDGKILVGKRISKSHGYGTWCPPGGHLEHGEELEECAKREAKEEAGIEIENLKFLTVTNDIFPEGLHYLTVWFQARWKRGHPKVLEPEKIETWKWVTFKELKALKPL